MKLTFQWSEMTPTQILAALKPEYVAVYQACSKAAAHIRKAGKALRKAAGKLVSCLWKSASSPKAGEVREPSGADPLGKRSTARPADWSEEQDAIYQFRCDQMRRNVDEEIAKEELFCEALRIVINQPEGN